MFLPTKQEDKQKQEDEETQRKQGYERVEAWVLKKIPENLREGVTINVNEVQCGDPNCSPIDTAITILFPSGGRGMFGIPAESKDVSEEDLPDFFPTPEVIEAWARGEEADWPPTDEPEMNNLPELRFEVEQRVQCRVGPDPVKGWAGGKVVQVWYREPNWPPTSFAPYKILLDDGRNIFAPGDLDTIIRKEK